YHRGRLLRPGDPNGYRNEEEGERGSGRPSRAVHSQRFPPRAYVGDSLDGREPAIIPPTSPFYHRLHTLATRPMSLSSRPLRLAKAVNTPQGFRVQHAIRCQQSGLVEAIRGPINGGDRPSRLLHQQDTRCYVPWVDRGRVIDVKDAGGNVGQVEGRRTRPA